METLLQTVYSQRPGDPESLYTACRIIFRTGNYIMGMCEYRINFELGINLHSKFMGRWIGVGRWAALLICTFALRLFAICERKYRSWSAT